MNSTDKQASRSRRADTLVHAVKLLEHVKTFARKKECRRQALLRYFGQKMAVADCKGTCDVCNPRLNLFRFEKQSIVDKRIEGFCRQSIKAMKFKQAFSKTKMRTSDVRRNNLLCGQSGSYVPEETKCVVVRGENKHALAANGFVAVNGDMSSEEDEYSDDEASIVVAALHSMQTFDDKLDALERAERVSASHEDRDWKRQKTTQ